MSTPQPRVSWRGALPFLGMAGALGVAFLLFSGLAQAWITPQPESAWMQAWLNPDEQARIERKLTAAELWFHPTSQPSTSGPDPLVLVLGLSTSREGIDGDILGRYLPPQYKVVNLGSSGGSFQELAFFTESLAWTKVKPRVIVLGIHPVWLAGRGSASPPPIVPDLLWQRMTHNPMPVSLGRFCRHYLWMLYDYRRTHNTLHNFLREHSVQRRLGLSPLSTGTDPFRIEHTISGPRASDEFLREQREAFRDLGWSNPDDPSRCNPSEELAWQQLLRRCSRITNKLMIVLLPESREFREMAQARGRATWMRSKPLPKGCEVIDLQSLVEEEGFFDLAHLNKLGSSALSHRIGLALKEQEEPTEPARATIGVP